MQQQDGVQQAVTRQKNLYMMTSFVLSIWEWILRSNLFWVWEASCQAPHFAHGWSLFGGCCVAASPAAPKGKPSIQPWWLPFLIPSPLCNSAWCPVCCPSTQWHQGRGMDPSWWEMSLPGCRCSFCFSSFPLQLLQTSRKCVEVPSTIESFLLLTRGKPDTSLTATSVGRKSYEWDSR